MSHLNIIIHFLLSANQTGVMEVWLDGVKKMEHTNINLGFCIWVNDAQSCGQDENGLDICRTEFKAGQYNYADNDYVDNETRTIYYDNVTMYNGSTNGYTTVDPSGNINIGDIRDYESLEAEDHDLMAGVEYETCSDVGGGQNISYLTNDDWVMFSDIDLTGLQSVIARTGSKYDGGYIEVRKGVKTGPLIGTIQIGNNEGWGNWATESVNLAAGLTGVHDVYFVFENDIRNGSLFNVNWFGFSTDLLSIDSNSLVNKINIYPNPVTNQLTISLANTNLNNSEVKISLLTINGQKVLELSPENNNGVVLDLSNIQRGVYLLKVSDKLNINTRKVVKI